jgi:hypothetical protein
MKYEGKYYAGFDKYLKIIKRNKTTPFEVLYRNKDDERWHSFEELGTTTAYFVFLFNAKKFIDYLNEENPSLMDIDYWISNNT